MTALRLTGLAALGLGLLTAAAAADPAKTDARSALRQLVAQEARARGVPVSLADAIVRVESNYNPAAGNGPNIGLTQISVASARALGYVGSPAGLKDPATNLRYGIQYLATAHQLAKGDVCLTIAKYQGGHRATRVSAAARAYCSKVQGHLLTADAR